LKRVLEPEVMDTAAEAMAYDAMDHAAVNERFVVDLLALSPRLEATLDLGTGTGLIVVELCRVAPEAKVTAIDLSGEMLELARAHAEAAGLMSQVRFDRIDAKQLPYDDGAFSCVLSNSIIHHIPEPLEALREAVRVTASGGRLFFRDLMRPETEVEVHRLVATYAAGETEYCRGLFSDSLRAALTLEEIGNLVGELGFDKQTVAATSDRHWTWSAKKKS